MTVEILRAENLVELGVRHGFTTRQGGVSSAPYDTLNLHFKSEDAPEHVLENFQRVAAAADLALENFVMTEQAHSTNILPVGIAEAGRGVLREGFTAIDGLMTDTPGLILTAYCADCALIFLADLDRRAVGIAHAGGVGTKAGMTSKIVERMCDEYGLLPEDLICAVSPCICGNCYEMDIKAENLRQLVAAGVPEGQIFISKHCTCEEVDTFFSHRAASSGGAGGVGGGHTGRQIGFITL
ncbi:laccase domain-containing protein [Candidatus Saccharibacteria bacterium]|nr:laccase domain-containing protein [Candidatus Saccharibacteria bacterium]